MFFRESRMIHESAFFEIAVILGLAALLGVIGQKLRQPLIITLLAAGILAGPTFLGIIKSYEQIELFAHIGIALLLFIVGLRLDLNLIRTTGRVALATGLGQIVFTSVIGFFIAAAMGMSFLSAAYVSVALTFSSTIIIVKLLSDKKEIDSLHGRIAVGFLIVQDIAAILALVALTTFGGTLGQGESAVMAGIFVAVKGLSLLLVVGVFMRYLIPPLTRWFARSQEMLMLFAIAWAVFLAAASELLGFSKEVGAFLAGISLASTEYRDSIGARLVGLRDFLLLFFFIDLGARLEWSMVGSQLGASMVFSLFVLVGNPIIVLAIMGVMGYRRRTSFLAGLTVAQISEFSLIVGALGVQLGHIEPEIMGLITLVGVVTIFASTYMILYSGTLYRLLSSPLKVFERRNPYRESTEDVSPYESSVDVILVGLGSYGSGVAELLLERKRKIIGVDFDPRALASWRTRRVSVLYGDMGDPEIHEHLPLSQTRWVVSTVRGRELNLSLVGLLRTRGFGGKVALTAINEEEAKLYQDSGAQVTLRPFRDAAEQAADALTQAMDQLPQEVDWPIAFREIRLRSGSAFAGKRIRAIPLRSETGASVLAVSRAGRVHYNPEPDFTVYPGDRLVITGRPSDLKQAEILLNQMQEHPEQEETEPFAIAEIPLAGDSPWLGRSLAELRFRQEFDATVIGIRRGPEQIVSPGPDETLHPADHVILIGPSAVLNKLKQKREL
jgi:Kef-type K+ transport system membrane component KefB/Trk K+ transport system NAD-binding subunit